MKRNVRNGKTMSKAENYIRDYTKRCSNETSSVEGGGLKATFYHEWLTPENALKAAKLEREEVIEKACWWLNTHDSYATPTNVKVEELRKYLKGN